MEKDNKVLKCIKCGSKEDLVSYKYTEIHEFGHEIKLIGQDVPLIPVCNTCKGQFEHWKERESMVIIPCVGAFGIFIIPTGFIIGIFLFGVNVLLAAVTLFITFIISSVLFIFYNILRKNLNNEDSNPNKYMKIIGMDIYVKPEKSEERMQYQDWIASI